MSYESVQDLRDKIAWEGGTTEFIFGYGISMSALPTDTPSHIREAFWRVTRVIDDINVIDQWLEDHEEQFV